MKGLRTKFLFFIIGISGLVVFLLTYNKVIPIANIKFRIDKQKSSILANEFARKNDFKINDYKNTTIFYYLPNVALYLQEAEGVEKANKLISEKNIYFYSWTTRYFKPLSEED